MRSFLIVRASAICIAAGLAVSLAGCKTTEDRLVYENYQQIHKGISTRAEVRDLLGEPDSQYDQHWIYQRPESHLNVMIEFDNGDRVSRKQWIAAEEARWEDSEDEPHDPTS